VETSTLEYFESTRIAGLPGETLMVRTATGRVLGRLRGLIIDPMNQHLRYLVVRASGLFSKATLVPAVTPRVDFDGRAIEIDVQDMDLSAVRNLTLHKALTTGLCARAA
jgi:hypothetical protein